MRLKKHGAGLKPTKIEIIPMIDVMFFLLVFFILTTIGVIKLEGLNVALPTAKTGGKTTKSQVTISINEKQEISINDTRVNKDSNIGPTLLKVFGTDDPAELKDKSVIISADRTVPHRMVVKCIDEAREFNIVKFAIATINEEEKQP